ncbi:MAG: hypothetical protein ABR53_07815 [Nitrosopumilus sp. BACL13 MAG-121220-bin23]|nr:MAG: hypothetical protein ABR53_07815 [Nitrosopumilus sp. BACL13 MAG-121220-bin23]
MFLVSKIFSFTSLQIYLKQFIRFLCIIIMSSKIEEEEEFAICVDCGNSIEKCMCVCPYCGERDKCECALFDAATGG